MSRRAAAAAVLVAAAALAVLWRLGVLEPLGAPWPGGGERRAGPAVPGARGRLAFVRDGDVWTYDLRDGAEGRLTQRGGAQTPRWAASGGWISFERAGVLWIVRSDGSGLFAVPGGDVPASARWAPRGVRLAYTSADGSLSMLDAPQGTNGRRIVVPPGSGAGPGVAWNGDATRIAYERHQRVAAAISNEGIWSVAATGRDPVPVYVASGDFGLHLCCFGIGGNFVYFWQGTTSAEAATDGLPLYVARAASSQPVQVAPAVLVQRTWIDSAARADAIVVTAGGGREATAGKSLIAVSPENVRGGVVGLRTNTLENDPGLAPLSPAWGPQNAFIAYSVGPSLTAKGGDLPASLANRRIWLVKPDGTDRRSLLSDATVPPDVSDERPLWARDGKTVLFARRLQPEDAVRTAPVATGLELWVALADGSVSRRITGGLADPGVGAHGVVPWETLFDYYRG